MYYKKFKSKIIQKEELRSRSSRVAIVYEYQRGVKTCSFKYYILYTLYKAKSIE